MPGHRSPCACRTCVHATRSHASAAVAAGWLAARASTPCFLEWRSGQNSSGASALLLSCACRAGGSRRT
eukprot:6968166-Alexandrium_andersonii.AAC.1